MLSDAQAADLIARSSFFWHQRFHLSEEVLAPGVNDIEWLLDEVGFPASLEDASVLDIGTTNGGAAFIAEMRGARRVVAVDIYDTDRFGFDEIRTALGSRVEFVKGSVYQLPELLDEQFDVVLFLGVLYHLRHPLLAIDSLRRLTRGVLYLETAVSGDPGDPSRADFYRRDELNEDSSNWFAPSISCLTGWVESSGFTVPGAISHWPSQHPERACLAAQPSEGEPEYIQISTETPLIVRSSQPPRRPSWLSPRRSS
jgi:tRNA (mo5U34)-methyltransferase